MKKFLAPILALVMLSVGCTDQWLKVALADLPVLTQMGLNIATLVATLDGQPVSAADLATIQNVSAEAGKGLSLLDTLYREYEANPSTGTIQKISAVITDLQNNLPAVLAAGHIGNVLLEQRVSAAVGLILTTVQSFAALLPTATPTTAQRVVTNLPRPKELKKAWNAQVYPQFK